MNISFFDNISSHFILIVTVSWLKEWKLRADREEKRKQQEKKQDEDSNGMKRS